MEKQTKLYEVKRARHTYDDHDHVYCAACGELVSGPHQATAHPKGRGAWARECSACGVVTHYDVDDGQPFGTLG
jgi:hypothetical protein